MYKLRPQVVNNSYNPAQVFDALVTGIVVLNKHLVILDMNSAAEDLLQTSCAHAVGLPLQDFIIRAELITAQLAKANATGQPFTEREATIRLPDNLSISVDFTVSIIEQPTSNGEQNNIMVVELQSLNRLQRINKDDESVTRQETARRLIRGLAHEIKNPLGGIRGAAQLLERELASAAQREYTSVIISEADRLKDLVDRMLGPQQQLHIAQVNILKVCEHVISLIEAEQPQQISWQRDYDPSLPDIPADEAQLIQALLNIVRNAFEALQDTQEPRIKLRSRVMRQFTIGTTRHRLAMQLDIIDNGPGIDPDLHNRIFFPMISGRPEGTGLGLAITQTIIAQHKGSVQVSSRQGQTCFSIYLPFSSHDNHADTPITEHNPNHTGTT